MKNFVFHKLVPNQCVLQVYLMLGYSETMDNYLLAIYLLIPGLHQNIWASYERYVSWRQWKTCKCLTRV